MLMMVIGVGKCDICSTNYYGVNCKTYCNDNDSNSCDNGYL